MATTNLMTAEDLWALADDTENRYDLIRGELVTIPPAGGEHGEIAFTIARLVGVYLQKQPIGKGYGAETGFILACGPDVVLAPDVAFVRMERLPPADERRSFLPLAPDLAVEVVSPSERIADAHAKVLEYLEAGTQVVWQVIPTRRTVTVYTPNHAAQILTVNDELDGGDVLPGFRVRVSELFE